MAYSAVPQAEINPDSDIVDTVFSRARDNWIAIKDGESGAPRIQTPALHPPTSGYNWAWEFYGSANTSATEWVEVGPFGLGSLFGWTGYGSMQIWRTGNYHFWVSIDRTNTSHTASVAVYRNGVRHSSIYTCPVGTAYQLYVFGLAFNAGDIITIMANSDDLSTIGVLAGMTDKPFSYIG